MAQPSLRASVFVPGAPGQTRRGEPATFGVPLPRLLVHDATDIALVSSRTGLRRPVQVRVLDRWPVDGSVRWALLDCRVDAPDDYLVTTATDIGPTVDDPLVATQTGASWTIAGTGAIAAVSTGAAEFLQIHSASAGDDHEATRVALSVTGANGVSAPVTFHTAAPEVIGPLRTTLRLDGTAAVADGRRLDLQVRLSWFAGVASVRAEVTLTNPHRAIHAGGFWTLGDPGSILLKDVSLVVTPARPASQCWFSERPDRELAATASVRIYQESSGGSNWRSAVHLNRDGAVPMRLPGYEVSEDGTSPRQGPRAQPVVGHAPQAPALAIRNFWQLFPSALEATPRALTARLLPGSFPDAHEIQGGERTTRVVGIAFGPDSVSDRPLEWLMSPSVARLALDGVMAAGAIPHLPAADASTDPALATLVNAAIEGGDTFASKRERIDEYGWRHFGDIFADHESARRQPDQPFVSHYNNQYDAIGGLLIQWLRSGDARWRTALDALARHVVDVDLYHTVEDKAAYNGGLFWHTFHYVDAGRSTHRSYPPDPAVPGGGPSNEHNYSTGLMHYHFLTGDPWARDAVIQLANWVIAMDDGALTPFRWLSRAATGLASSTATTDYHGPGRGAGNSVMTLLNASRLTGESRYLAFAETLIRRCIHPEDDVASRDLLNVERRWSYTVFLEALARYLDDKADRHELDAMYGYARGALLHYARWMADHERPYLDHQEVLEFPTETWAAQDMRKCDVFLHASRHVCASDERARFNERADFFYRASLDWLGRFSTRTCARPVVLMLTHGFLHATARGPAGLMAAPVVDDTREYPPSAFTPQKQIAARRAKLLGGVAFGLVLMGALAIMALP